MRRTFCFLCSVCVLIAYTSQPASANTMLDYTAIVLSVAPAVHAATMTFGDGVSVNSLGYTEAGLVISDVTGAVFPRIRDWPATASVDGATLGGPETGEREFLFNQGDGTVKFSLSAVGTFSLLSFDVENPAGLATFSAFEYFDVLGSNGASVQLYGGSFGTDVLPGTFSGLDWFTVSCASTTTSCQVTLDNITFEPSTSVPEPSSLALLGFVVVGLAASRRLRERDWQQPAADPGDGDFRLAHKRHTFASLLLHLGESPQYVREQMGHHSIQITVDTYGHLIPGANRQAVNRLDDNAQPANGSATETQPAATPAQPKRAAKVAAPVTA